MANNWSRNNPTAAPTKTTTKTASVQTALQTGNLNPTTTTEYRTLATQFNASWMTVKRAAERLRGCPDAPKHLVNQAKAKERKKSALAAIIKQGKKATFKTLSHTTGLSEYHLRLAIQELRSEGKIPNGVLEPYETKKKDAVGLLDLALQHLKAKDLEACEECILTALASL